MLKKKCTNCAKKIERKFDFCPYCGYSFRKQNEEDDFGLIGRDDFVSNANFGQEIRMPLGLNKIMNSLMKQLEKEMGAMSNNVPGGFKIQISTGEPRQQKRVAEKQEKARVIDSREIEKIRALPRKEAESNVRRLSDRIVYEVSVPGVKSKDNVVISKLENGIEIKAYSNDMCYVKTIPLNSDVIGYKIKDGVLFLELSS